MIYTAVFMMLFIYVTHVISCSIVSMLFMIFFFKQKTAYEMRISDWSSDVCSSDLPPFLQRQARLGAPERKGVEILAPRAGTSRQKIGRASCRERVCQYV